MKNLTSQKEKKNISKWLTHDSTDDFWDRTSTYLCPMWSSTGNINIMCLASCGLLVNWKNQYHRDYQFKSHLIMEKWDGVEWVEMHDRRKKK